MTDHVCLYFGRIEECQNCGGWTKAPFDPSLDEYGEPCADPRFCSLGCATEAQEYITVEAR